MIAVIVTLCVFSVVCISTMLMEQYRINTAGMVSQSKSILVGYGVHNSEVGSAAVFVAILAVLFHRPCRAGSVRSVICTGDNDSWLFA